VGLLWGEAGAARRRFRPAPAAPQQGTALPLSHAGGGMGKAGLRTRTNKRLPAARSEGKSVSSGPASPERRGGGAAGPGRHYSVE